MVIMYSQRRILAVVPARGGSKGLPAKNLQYLAGVPLVGHAARVASAVTGIDRAVVSTDSEDIAAAAREHGLSAPFFRPEELSGDRVGDQPVLAHALAACEALDGTTYDIVLMLQPTSPLRRPEHVSATIEMLISGNWDAVWTVSPTDSKSHPLKQLCIEADNSLNYYDTGGADVIARQQLSPVFHRNGIAYAVTRECLTTQGKVMGRRTGALVVDEPAVSIDTQWDIDLVEWIMNRRSRNTAT